MAFPTAETYPQNAGPTAQPNGPFTQVTCTLNSAKELAGQVQELVNALIGPVPQAVEGKGNVGGAGILTAMVDHTRQVQDELNNAFNAIDRLKALL